MVDQRPYFIDAFADNQNEDYIEDNDTECIDTHNNYTNRGCVYMPLDTYN